MIDFKKRLNSNDESRKINPIEIYQTLDRSADKGPLRPAQNKILLEWFENHRDNKDVIVKLHTGQGKTLIGLLILQSFLNNGGGPVMYVCPDKYLVEQTCSQASQFGIEFVTIDDEGDIPSEFYDSKAMLIVHVQKVFNGLSKFGIGNKGIDVGAIVLDDSHACINSIEDSANIKIPKGGDLYDGLVSIFEDFLKDQGLVVFKEILEGKSSEVMAIPYWAWVEKHEIVVETLIKHNEEINIFPWSLIKDEIEQCRCLISSNRIEIIPLKTPIYKYKFFDKASHRILMSATTNNDASFVKGLGISKESIISPLMDPSSKWSGEKMILVPYYIDHELDRATIVNWLAEERPKRIKGVVALTPSNKDADYWESCGAEKATSDTMFMLIQGLREGKTHKTVVFANRYDGIDLPDQSCRILILDERPYSQTLFDEYQEEVRGNSDLVNVKIAQKIEQGLGRGVRGEKDYCVIILNGTRLIAAIKDRKLKRFFSPQTRKQVEIGLELSGFALQDSGGQNSKEILKGVMLQCLKRDEGWKAYYNENMNSIETDSKDPELLEILSLEAEAEHLYRIGDYSKATEKYQNILDNFIKDDAERGWYLQEMARAIYPSNKEKSNQLQSAAHKTNHYLLKPPSGIEFVQLQIKEERSIAIKHWIESFDNFTSLKIQLDNILSGLVFGPNYKEFEKSFDELGKILGFNSERPELEWKEGPDNLWCIGPNQYLIIECKSGVSIERKRINKNEAEQLLHSTEWFKKNYPGCKGHPLLIIPTRTLETGVHLSSDCRILRRGQLNSLKKRVRDFYQSFQKTDFRSLSIDQISRLIIENDLTSESVLKAFEAPVHLK